MSVANILEDNYFPQLKNMVTSPSSKMARFPRLVNARKWLNANDAHHGEKINE
jgi:hypothetical protein